VSSIEFPTTLASLMIKVNATDIIANTKIIVRVKSNI
jgi:hypothetical protein